jgi:hypothetical protein
VWYEAEEETVKKDAATIIKTIQQGELIMNAIERKTLYFLKEGEANTDALLKFVKAYAEASGVNHIVVASTSGETGVKASEVFKGFNVVVVTHHAGFAEPGVHELAEKNRLKILKNGAQVLTATHALSSVERAIRKEFGTIQPLELIAYTLRRFGQGTKVCVEVTLMAADAELIPIDRDIIAIAGSSQGADTALLIKPANASRFFDLKIKEIIAKPKEFE